MSVSWPTLSEGMPAHRRQRRGPLVAEAIWAAEDLSNPGVMEKPTSSLVLAYGPVRTILRVAFVEVTVLSMPPVIAATLGGAVTVRDIRVTLCGHETLREATTGSTATSRA
jgi:hypothetical protein